MRMSIGIFAALLFGGCAREAAIAASPVVNETCVKLQTDFDSWERLWGSVHDLNESLVDISRDLADRLYNNARGVAAAGGPSPSDQESVISSRRDLASAINKLKTEDEEYAARGDRIVTMIIANKCPSPDHIMSWSTYSRKNLK